METKLVFNRKNKLNSDGKALIEIQIYLSRGKRPYKSSGIWIEPKFWDKAKMRITKKHPNHDFLNQQLVEFKTNIERLLLEQKITTGAIDISILDKKKNVFFFDFMENHVMKVSNIELTPATSLIYKRVLKYLREFSEDVPFTQVNVQFLERYNKFLIDQKKLSINSRSAQFKKIKKVINIAISNDIILFSNSPFNKGFSVKEIEPAKQSLSIKDLEKLESLDMYLRPELRKTREMFLFSCYTSMRFGDVINLSFENFEVLENGKIRLVYIMNKSLHRNTKKISWIVSDFWNGKIDNIVKRQFELFESYRNHPIENRKFFNYTNQHYNRELKELQRFAEIKIPLTSHLARHTSITLLVNDFGLDITKAQLIAGHSRIEMTQRYLHITERDLSDAGKKIQW